MLRHWLDERLAASTFDRRAAGAPLRTINTSVGTVRILESGATRSPCVVLAPDGPNVIEHYPAVIGMLAQHLRVVCIDMPGFGFSAPRRDYDHSLNAGARAILGLLDALEIPRATLAFSCANGSMPCKRLAWPLSELRVWCFRKRLLWRACING